MPEGAPQFVTSSITLFASALSPKAKRLHQEIKARRPKLKVLQSAKHIQLFNDTYSQIIMFSKLAVVFVSAAAIVSALPGDPATDAVTTTNIFNKTTNKCNVGTLSCCKLAISTIVVPLYS